MTTANSTKKTVQRSHLGTLSMLAWTGDPEAGHDTPFLLVYSCGDGDGGPEACTAALLGMIGESGLKAGAMSDATETAGSSPIRVLVEGGQAVLNMPYLSAQCVAPPEWLAAAEAGGRVHLVVASRPWPQGVPGQPVSEETLHAFLGDDETLNSAAHVLLRVTQLR
ncbi:DUF5949 family protein [Streptomyces sp. NPDC051018]|uniref:DUF5949 family protein n=1 Tax=Streptomyces sp. NPDC051018 TaxID=3365639 RepID=UPI00379D1BE8